ncbi:class I SAM-dependent methyltransferase [Deltaproteobacteria bacterium OttesenSCG-928-K17]|nr:class I SAM-dependent methyltransferase [Deltaproteobacteria bacterium OttesenSCG-928-K17]
MFQENKAQADLYIKRLFVRARALASKQIYRPDPEMFAARKKIVDGALPTLAEIVSKALAADPLWLPEECEPSFYRSLYPDAASMKGDREVRRHYANTGRDRGDLASPAAHFLGLSALVEASRSILEIGPFLNPRFEGSKTKYFEIHSTAALRRMAESWGKPRLVKIPDIDFVSPDGDLSIVSERFHAVFSCHCLEHVPDIISHFQAVSRILDPGGRYYLVIPDHRFCFDHYAPTAAFREIIKAHRLLQGRQNRHGLRALYKGKLLATHNETQRHWLADHCDPDFLKYNFKDRLAELGKTIAESEGVYLSCHAWQFTPESFRLSIKKAQKLNLIDLDLKRVFNTPCGRAEFIAVLEK